MNAESRNLVLTERLELTPSAASGRMRRVWRWLMSAFARAGFYYRFNTIAGRILAVNIISLVVLVLGLLYLNDFRDGLIGAKIKALEVQTDIIARSVEQNTTYDSSSSTPAKKDLLFTMQHASDEGDPQNTPIRIDPERSAKLLRSLLEPTRTHGIIYNTNGQVLVDSNKVYLKGELSRFQQAQRTVAEPGIVYKTWLRIERFLRGENLPLYSEKQPAGSKPLTEVSSALDQGKLMPMVRVNELGETVLSVAAPIRRDGPVLGALFLVTAGGEIDEILARERASIIRLWVLVLAVTAVFSLVLGSTIAGPVHRLAVAAENVRNNIKKREEIPDFGDRSDEIGDLSKALREMTATLYKRLDAIGSFAADVAHELKNPLTSLRSAADTLTIVKNDEDRDRLVQIIQHDVKRLNRLISDISDASRLDAELARESRRPVNVASLLDAMCGVVNDIHREGSPIIDLQILGMARRAAITSKGAFVVSGHESRLGQVVHNLLDNAISFSPPNGKILVTCRHIRQQNVLEVTVEDEGPGVRPENLERIFERFYTDRPSDEEFGQNSGLGLNISRQIIGAHNGRIWAENRVEAGSKASKGEGSAAVLPVIGARFVIQLPALS